jgi:ketosteroid isomerase-like protein
MQPRQTPVTGNEDQGDLSSPYQALVQFYYAFNHRDREAMANNWAAADEVAMDNPLGGIKRGRPEIMAVYERIFNGSATVQVEFFDYTIHEAAEMFYAVGRERGYFRVGENEIKLAIRTSRIFRKYSGRWRQVHHHGSIDDPELLKQYQTAISATSS